MRRVFDSQRAQPPPQPTARQRRVHSHPRVIEHDTRAAGGGASTRRAREPAATNRSRKGTTFRYSSDEI